jgi:hypothetical protein
MAGLVVDQEAEKLDIEMAAKIIGAIPASRIPCQVGFTHPQPLWLLTESYLLQNKDTTPIHAGAMENRGKNKDRGEILNDILKGLLPDYF